MAPQSALRVVPRQLNESVCVTPPQVLVVRFASLFDVKDRTVTFLGGKKYSMDTLRAMGAGDLLNSMFDFSEKLMNLGLSEEEMSMFTAVVLVSAGGPRRHDISCRFA